MVVRVNTIIRYLDGGIRHLDYHIKKLRKAKTQLEKYKGIRISELAKEELEEIEEAISNALSSAFTLGTIQRALVEALEDAIKEIAKLRYSPKEETESFEEEFEEEEEFIWWKPKKPRGESLLHGV